MRITIESTTKVVHLNGVPARIWEGKSERGVRVVAFISRLTPMDDDSTQYEEELIEVRAPSADVAAFPLRMIL